MICLAFQWSKKNPQKFYQRSRRLTLSGFRGIMIILYNFELKHLAIPLEAYNRIKSCRLFYKSSSNFNIYICLPAAGYKVLYSCYETLIHLNGGVLSSNQNRSSFINNYFPVFIFFSYMYIFFANTIEFLLTYTTVSF